MKKIANFHQLQKMDLNDPSVIDSVTIDKKSMTSGLVKFLVFTTIAILIFFIPMEIEGKSTILFGYIYSKIISILGNSGLWLVAIIIIINGLLSIYGKYFAKEKSSVFKYYESDSIFHPLLYLMGAIFILLYALSETTGLSLPDIIVGSKTGGVVVPDIVLGVAWIIPVGAFFVPFLLDYGSIDFIGVILEPLMRPLFKVPGKSAVDAIASFVGSSSMAVIITSRLYKSNVYTKKEAAIIATSFSAVSVGYANLVIRTAGMSEHFLKTYFSSFLLTFVVSFFVVRIYPLKGKKSVYYNGRVQTSEELQSEGKYELGMFKKGVERASKKAFASGSIVKKIKESIIDGVQVVPKVISLLCAIGIAGMIVAKYTPFFDYVGLIFLPIMKLLQIPDAAEIAGSIPTGITEMFLPVLVIADKVDILSEGARYFVIAVSMVQIIFFAETVVVMTSTGIPVKLSELVLLFFIRTLIAIPFAALFMHILF